MNLLLASFRQVLVFLLVTIVASFVGFHSGVVLLESFSSKQWEDEMAHVQCRPLEGEVMDALTVLVTVKIAPFILSQYYQDNQAHRKFQKEP